MMNYIFLEINAETMEMTAKAVDGHRVSIEKTRLEEADYSFTCFIKPNIPKITRYDLNATVELINGKCFVQVSESIVGYVQPEGEYINLEKIINETEQKEVKAHVFVDANLLKEALASVEVKGNINVPIVCEGMMYADCGMVSFVSNDRLDNFIRRATDAEMQEIEKGIAKCLGIELKMHSDELLAETTPILPAQESTVEFFSEELTEAKAEAKIYKNLYENLLAKVMG